MSAVALTLDAPTLWMLVQRLTEDNETRPYEMLSWPPHDVVQTRLWKIWNPTLLRLARVNKSSWIAFLSSLRPPRTEIAGPVPRHHQFMFYGPPDGTLCLMTRYPPRTLTVTYDGRLFGITALSADGDVVTAHPNAHFPEGPHLLSCLLEDHAAKAVKRLRPAASSLLPASAQADTTAATAPPRPSCRRAARTIGADAASVEAWVAVKRRQLH